MLEHIKALLKQENIDLIATLSLEECKIKRPYLLERAGISHGSVIIFAVPYMSRNAMQGRNVSLYAVPRDYHLYFADLFNRILPALKETYPENKFAAFTDHSPIDEISAAALSGLGVIGKNHLLITKKYSSLVFLGEIITDAALPSSASKADLCIGCNKCIDACPVGTDRLRCLSSLTQKKGELSEDEKKLIKDSGCVWGCDICQEVCPYTKAALEDGTIFSQIEFFNSELTPYITSDGILSLSDDDFSLRAYSWRGRDTVMRNILISECEERNGENE